MLACGRYIERNPVACGMVSYAEDYHYSSAKYYVKGEEDTIISKDPLYVDFGKEEKEREANYRQFLLTFDRDAEESYNNFDTPVGDPLFISRLHKEEGRYLPRRQGRPKTKIFVS